MSDAPAAGSDSDPSEIQALIDHLPDLVFRLDRALRHVLIGPRISAWTGIPREHFLGRTGREAGLPPEACDALEPAALRALERGQPEEISFAIGERTLRARLVPERDAGGRVASVLGIAEDVGARRGDEAERAGAAEQLRHQAELLDLAGDAVVATDTAFRVTTWNRSAEALYGFAQREALGRNIDELLRTEFPEGLEAIARPLRENAAARVELVHYTKAGVPLRIQASVVELRDAEGRSGGTLGILRDVTELKRKERALQESDRRKSEFLAVLSHELRNPLAPIRNSIYLLDRLPPDSEQAARAWEVLRRQTEHLSRLVDDLLDLTRIDHGKIELRQVTLEVREVVRRVCDDQRALLERSGLELELRLPEERLWVRADPARLEQMIGNLLTNARKYTTAGGHVRVGLERLGDACAISVRDDGLGIATEDLDRIFDPFVQAQPSLVRGGLGIGLALVRDLAARHGGTVRAESAGRGRGAEFTIRLPCAEPAPVLPSGRSRPPAAAPLSVLVVEDNPDAAASLADLLAIKGHRTVQAATGRGGIEAAVLHPPDVLVCDVGLPDMLGYEVVRAVRAMPTGRDIFAVALTGYAQQHDRERAMAAGFDAHLAKPAPEADLDALLGEAARRRGAAPPAP